MRKYFIIIFLSIIFFKIDVIGQTNLAQLEKQYGKGEITILKEVVISFFYNETSKKYEAKATHKIQKIKKQHGSHNGLIQIPFNTFQDLKLKNARYFKFDSTGNKRLVENVKVKYADIKDYFIDGIFYNDLKVKQFRSSVDLPDTYFVSYSYDIIYHDLKFLNSFYFQDGNEAVDKTKITIRKHPKIKFTTYELNFLPEISKEEDEDRIIFKVNALKRSIVNSHSVSTNYFLPHVIVSVNSYQTPEGNDVEILKSTQSLYNWYQELLGGLPHVDVELMKETTSSILSQEMSDEEKIEAILKWMQANIQYVAFENGIAGFQPEEAEKVLLSKFGDCKGMANLLVNLLRIEGFDARHAWIGTRSNNYSYSIPSLVVDNHMICALKFNNQFYYLDATSKSANWKISPPHLIGKEVLIADGVSSYLLNTIEISNPEDNRINISGNLLVNNKNPKIDLEIIFEGYFKNEFFSYYQYSSNKKKKSLLINYIERYLDGIDIDTIKNIKINREEVSFGISGTYSNFVSGSSKDALFPFLDVIEYDFSATKAPPTYIKFPFQIFVDLMIDNDNLSPIEGGSLSKEFQNDSFSSYYKIHNKGTHLQINQAVTINSLYIFPKQYPDWNNFIDFNSIHQNHSIYYENRK